jgi:adenylate kinase
MNIILLGAPGSGKGSTSEQLISRKGMTQLSTGDLFRKNIAEKTALGLEAQKFMNAGKYVPVFDCSKLYRRFRFSFAN